MFNVVIMSVFQAIGYLIGNTTCVLPADECSDVGNTQIVLIFSIVIGANSAVEQTVVDGVRTTMAVADVAAGKSIVTMDIDIYPTTLDITSFAAAHKSGYVPTAAHATIDVQVLDGVVIA